MSELVLPMTRFPDGRISQSASSKHGKVSEASVVEIIRDVTAVPENLVLNRFFFLEALTDASVSRVKSASGWGPSGFPEKMGYHGFTGAGVAGGSPMRS